MAGILCGLCGVKGGLVALAGAACICRRCLRPPACSSAAPWLPPRLQASVRKELGVGDRRWEACNMVRHRGVGCMG